MSSYNLSHGHIEPGQHRKHKRRNNNSNRYLPASGHTHARDELTSQQKWLSIGALDGHAPKPNESSRKNFARLRKGYASMRKSFRVLGGAEQEQEQAKYARVEANSASLINQIGSNAARLLRRGVTQVRLNKLYATDHNDAIQCTDGSFKVISPGPSQAHHNDQTAPVYANLGAQFEPTSAAGSGRLKSEAEREVDVRLRRSKRRVLPSAQYKPPNSERACEGLDLEELEEIKRDNLRLTLRSQKAGLSRAPAKELEGETFSSPGGNKQEESPDDAPDTNNVEPRLALDAIVCSCKHFEGKDEDEQDAGGRYEEIGDSKHYYCSCASISSFSCRSEESAIDSQRIRDAGTPEERDLDIATSDELCENGADETHEQFVNLLAEGRKALSQPNLSYFAYNREHTEADVVRSLRRVDDDRDESNCAKGVAGEEKTIECESGMAREKEDDDDGQGTGVEVMKSKGEQEEGETASYAHASSVTLNVRELEKLCGDLVKSCAQQQQEQDVQLCDVVGGGGQRDGDDYHNEKCPADGGDGRRAQQQEVTTCCRDQVEWLGFTNSNERKGERTARVAREQVELHAKHNKYQVADLSDNASAPTSSCRQQVGGVSNRPSKATRADHHCRLADAEQQRQQQVDRTALAAQCTANNQSDRDLHGKQRTAVDAERVSPDTTCGGFAAAAAAADLTSGHLSGQPAPAINNQEERLLIDELPHSLENNLRATNKCQVPNEPIQHQADLPIRSSSIYQTLQESCGPGDRDSERRRRQQQRRQEIMLSLTGQPEHLWHELVAEGARVNERAVDTRAYSSATYGGPILPPLHQASAKENIYSSLYEDLAQGHYSALGADIDYETTTTSTNYQNLHEKERRLFEEQLNSNLRMIKKSACCGAQETQSAAQCNRPRPHKKSLLSKLKSLLAPSAAAAANGAKGERDTFAHLRAGWMTSSQNVCSATAGQHHQNSRWDDLNRSTSHLNSGHSRALGTMSTQNLFNSSMRYLSTSRKSINVASSSKDGSPAGGETDGSLFSSKSFISGFLTLGRRSGATAATTTAKDKRASRQRKEEFESLSQLFRNNRHQQNAQMHRGYGSFDSLPSADSGLSCGHLLNTSSCDENHYATTPSHAGGGGGDRGNIYSCTPAATLERVEQQFLYDDDDDDEDNDGGESDCDNRRADGGDTLPPATAMVAVGRARARVDCNPCAYDKEALVFKRGDLVDILERHQSGTWIGRCNGRVGHFKFINVAEIKEHDSQAGQQVAHDDAPASVSSPCDDGVTCRRSPPGQSGPYVTKLEIKNGDQKPPTNGADSEPSIRRRSLSSSMAARSEQVQELSASKLASSSETLMGSLEQLLASIGLDNCRQACGPENDRSSSCDNSAARVTAVVTSERGDEQERRDETTDGDLSYLEMLKRSGIDSLDSFSAIERSSDLQRVGIIDDEHQRRLLMAAKIIRQALRAAKLDLQQGQRRRATDNRQLPVCKSEPISAEGDSSGARREPPPLPPPMAQRPTGRNGDKTARLRCERNQPAAAAASIKTMGANHRPGGDSREPVYVNLLPGTNKSGSPIGGQSAAAGRNERSARASAALVTPAQSNKSIPRQSLTTFGTNFLFNDLSQVGTVLELSAGGTAEKALQLDCDHYQDHNECQPMTIANQRHPASAVRNNISAQQERTTDNASQRSVQQPHLVNRDCATAAAAAVLLERGVNNSLDSINQPNEETDSYQMMGEMQECADGNNNQQADRKGDEPIASQRPPPPFTRGCSVRVSSRKPKRASSRLTSREPRRGSQDCSRIYLPLSNSVGGGQSSKQRRDPPPPPPPPAHCSIRSLRHRGSSSDLNRQANPANLHPGQLVSNCTLDHRAHAHPVRARQRAPLPAAPRAPARAITTTHQTHDSYHHLLNSQSQIMNSKSAYDLRVNFSKFLEN